MKWSFRWYGEGDSITLEQVKQIPGVKGVIGTLLGKMPGDLWAENEIAELKKTITDQGMQLYGIESVAISDAIKAGTPERDQHINNYIETIKNLSKNDIHLICYSFKPIFGWAKTDLNYPNDDGSHTLMYDQSVVDKLEPKDMYNLINSQSHGFKLSGWEEKRLDKLNKLLALYDGFTEADLFDNLAYFLTRIIPVCEEYDVKMAIHPDDPPWELFGLPRITKNKEDILKILNIVDSPYNGITLCTGALGANPDNDIVDIIHAVNKKINFVHFRNVEYLGNKKFKETAHTTESGSLNMRDIMKALIEVDFDGVIRPDHGRDIWGEVARPGYGLYDRALGLTYMQGLYEGLTGKSKPIK